MNAKLSIVALTAVMLATPSLAEGRGRGAEVFHIGKHDHAFTEFARDRKPGAQVVFHVGQSSASRDWYAYQPGSFDYLVGRSTREKDWTEVPPTTEGELSQDSVPIPFQIDFELPSVRPGSFILHLDAIFRYQRPAAPWYVVDINGHTGRYRLVPRPAPELWWAVGPAVDIQFVGY